METIQRKKSEKYRDSIRINGQQVRSPLFDRKTDCVRWKAEPVFFGKVEFIYG